MSSSTLKIVATAMTILGFVGCAAPEPEKVSPPHLLLISLDAFRADHLSSSGYYRHTTPFLDELAAQGVRFSHASVNTHGTPSSHTTMLSSLYQETHRVWADPAAGTPRAPSIPAEVELIQEILGGSGWTTAAVTGGGWMSATYGFSRGFDFFSDEGRAADQGVELFVETLGEALLTDDPVFAFFHTYQVHSPYLPPDGYRTLFGEYSGSVKPTSEALRPFVTTAGQHLDQNDFDFLVSQYDGEIRFLDDSLRELFARLAEIGFLDNAVVLITADHGEEFGDHGGLLHRGSLFEELVRVPFIVWGQGVPAGVVDPTLVSAVDIVPTLLTAAGFVPPPIMEGRDVLADHTVPWADQRIFAQYRDALYSVRTPRFKLIEGTQGRRMLFDLERDPRERRNIAAEHPDLTAALAAELEVWRSARPGLGDAASSRTEIDPSTEEQLKALGYLD
jgi:arylsulfatase A-like enzyme